MTLKYKNILLLLINILCFCEIHGLYEDQIKKFDWRKLNVGKVKAATFDQNTPERIVLVTEENVIAAINTRTGELIWRQILEKSPRGDIKLVNFQNNFEDLVPSVTTSNGVFDILTVNGIAPTVVRGWISGTGNLAWEWSLMPLHPEKAKSAMWFEQDNYLYHVVPVWRSHLEVTKYSAFSGQGKGTTSKISAPWIIGESCLLVSSYYVCLEGSLLTWLDLTSENPHLRTTKLSEVPTSSPKILKGRKNTLIIDGKIISIDENAKLCTDIRNDNIVHTYYNKKSILLETSVSQKSLYITAKDAETCEVLNSLSTTVPYPDYHGEPEVVAFNCRQRKGGTSTCSFVISTSNAAMIFIQDGNVKWTREESLANIVATELIDLPLSDTEGAIESELSNIPGDIILAFTRRITSQLSHIKNLRSYLIDFGMPSTTFQKENLTRDAFGLHKMLVILTKYGKIFGIDNLSGKIHWKRYLPLITNFNNDEKMKLVIQRTSKHFPLPALCTIVAKNSVTGNGIVYRFNPITGEPMDNEIIKLNYQIKQITLLRETEVDYLKGLLLLDQDNRPHVLPENTSDMADGMYIFIADKDSGSLTGLYVKSKKGQLSATPIWRIYLGGHDNMHEIIAIAGKNPMERVHSQGRVLSDRSVLYKYINPNLVAVATQAPDNVHKYILNMHLIDAVSGSIVFSMTHRKVRKPFNIVHSENWLAYSYYNDKVRRTEITTIELYEGKVQANSTVWSSFDSPPFPMVERQSYIIPTTIETMRETITERGITNKHVLIGTSSGAIIEMPWSVLDPRRPMTNQAREEGAYPYIPELPLPTESTVNYNQSIARISNIYTAPSGLESTCLVVAYGLDLFVTRVAPSKTFDLLKEDFDYFLITVVLIGLIVGSLVTHHLSSRKALKQAWK